MSPTNCFVCVSTHLMPGIFTISGFSQPPVATLYAYVPEITSRKASAKLLAISAVVQLAMRVYFRSNRRSAAMVPGAVAVGAVACVMFR